MRSRILDVFLRQEEATSKSLSGKHVVVIDVLRAASTLTAAFAAGAIEAYTFRTVRDLFSARRKLSGRPLLLCGERGRLPVRGFDLGNSPRDFTPEICGGRTLLMTTTNGTRALFLARQAKEVILGCFLNLASVSNYLRRARGDIALLCAGTEGDLSDDDIACAGAIVEKLSEAKRTLTPTAEEALHTWRRARRSLKQFLLASRGGLPLVQAGLGQDILDCAHRSRFDAIPRVAAYRDGGPIIRPVRESRRRARPEPAP